MEWNLIWLANLCSWFSAVLMCFSVHMWCVVKTGFSAFPLSTQCLFVMVVVEDLFSLLPICLVEDKHMRKSLIGEITVKRDSYDKHSLFSETQKLWLPKTQISDVHVTNLFWLMKFFWTFINKANTWCDMLERGNESSVSDDWIARYTRG